MLCRIIPSRSGQLTLSKAAVSLWTALVLATLHARLVPRYVMKAFDHSWQWTQTQIGSKRNEINLGDQCKPLLHFGISSPFKTDLAFQGRAMWRRAGVKVKVITSKALVCSYRGEALSALVIWIDRITRQDFCLKCWSHLDMCLNSFYKVIPGLSKTNPHPVLGGKNRSPTPLNTTLCKSTALAGHEILADFAKQALCLFPFCLPFTWHTGRDASRGWQETCVT